MLARSVGFALALLLPLSAQANGRMPGANDLAFNDADPEHVVARATFGIMQTRDRGKSWSWICEQAIDSSGVIADPPLGLMQDGSLVLLPPTGSALVSHDGGCDWQRVGAPLADKRGVDLTLDPSTPTRLLVITATLASIDALGFGAYENLVVETRDNGKSFQLLATLPSDFEAETIEVAKSDSQRLYVSGTDTVDPRLGVLYRSEDGGQNWSRSTLALAPGTGGLFISAIHPEDPDRLWLRVAARGDTIGLLPAQLVTSSDKGQTFQELAATQRGMFGFALSPDGSRLAYGGPSDGLWVGPSDGSSPYEKRANLGVRCLRWPDSGLLHVCASEPADEFSVGVSSDEGRTFQSLYRLADTCPAECAADSAFASSCESAWVPTRFVISASAEMCSVPWARPPAEPDAGVEDAGVEPDAAQEPELDAALAIDASTLDAADGVPYEQGAPGSDCSCGVARRGVSAGWLLALIGLLGTLGLRRARRPSA